MIDEAARLRYWLNRIVTAAGDADYLRDLAHMALDGEDPTAFIRVTPTSDRKVTTDA